MARIHQQWAPHAAAKFGLLFLMYISQKVFLTFTWTLLPIILRKQGVSLGAIGFTALVYSPWALKFLYASHVDRYYSSRLGKRKSWIVPLLCLSWLLLPCLALLSPAGDLAPVLGLIFVLNFLFATIDIAVDGYATDILSPQERPWGTAIQMVGYLLGYMMGAGLFLIVYQNLGWARTVFLITALQLILMLPVLLHKEISPIFYNPSPIEIPGKNKDKPSVWLLIKQARALWFLLFLMIVTVFEQGGNQLRLPLFVDLGISPQQLGHINIWIGTPISIAGAVLGGAFLRQLGARKVYISACLGAAAVSLATALLSLNTSLSLWQAGALMGADKLIIGIITVLTYSMTMTMAAGSQSATNYAALSSASHLTGFIIMPLTGILCDMVGYFSLYFSLALTGVLSIFIGNYLLINKLNYSEMQIQLNNN